MKHIILTIGLLMASVFWAAEKGHSAAQYSLGNCYYYGNGVKKDGNTALYWFEKARDGGFDAEEDVKKLKAEGYSSSRAKQENRKMRKK